jgi:hypothetical protein
MSAGKMHDDEVNIPDAIVRRLLVEQFPRWAQPLIPRPYYIRAGTVSSYIVGTGDELRSIEPGMLVLMDRNFPSMDWLNAVRQK